MCLQKAAPHLLPGKKPLRLLLFLLSAFQATPVTADTGTAFEADFRTVQNIPGNLNVGGPYSPQDLSLETVDNEQVLSLNNPTGSNPFALAFTISDLASELEEFPYLIFHFKPDTPKSYGGVINFRIDIVINGIRTQWDSAASNGVLNAKLAADQAQWAYAAIDLGALVDHWKQQTRQTGQLILEEVRIFPGASSDSSEQHWGKIYFRDMKIGDPSALIALNHPSCLIPHGDPVRITPTVNGTIYMTEWERYDPRLPRLRRLAATSRGFSATAVAGTPMEIPTANLYSGRHIIVLEVDGVIESTRTVHLAFNKIPSSPDYEITVTRDGRTESLFVHYSEGRRSYFQYNSSLSITRDWFIADRIMPSLSYAISSHEFPMEVRIRIKPGARDITLPLTSAKILPSSYGIPCTIENGDTIVFTMDRPEKVVVFPNFDAAWQVFQDKGAGHVPIQSWDSDYSVEKAKPTYKGTNLTSSLSEGYQNPLVFIAHGPDLQAPAKHAASTLVIAPGDQPTQEDLDSYETLWFEPGAHDFSAMGAPPFYNTYLRAGQTMHLEEGAYVLARVRKDTGSDTRESILRGHGILSGLHHKWIPNFENASQIISVDTVEGITSVERASFSIYAPSRINDIALLAPWHANTDGPDYIDDCRITNSFLMAHDDNLKLNDNTYAKHLVLWQLGNAHAIMVKETRDEVAFSDTTIEDIDIIAHLLDPSKRQGSWPRIGLATIACVTGSQLDINNLTIRDVRIESPFLFRVIDFYNLDTNQSYTPGWFSPTDAIRHTRINGVLLENITVHAPIIAYRSLLGSAYDNAFTGMQIVNLDINGTAVSEANKDTFFEIEYTQVEDLAFFDSLYSAWSWNQQLTGGPADDDDLDGRSNLYEFAFAGDPLDPEIKGGAVLLELAEQPGTLTLSHPVLNKPHPRFQYTIEYSENLLPGSWRSTRDIDSLLSSSEGPYTRVSRTLTMDTASSRFFRIRAELTE